MRRDRMSPEQVRRARVRFGYAIAGANFAGGMVVFLFGNYVLPVPPGVHDHKLAVIVNLVVFLVAGGASMPIGWFWSKRRWNRALRWATEGRDPTDAERTQTLRLPLRQQGIVAIIWGAAATVFAALNAPFSAELAGNVAITIVLGGLITCALGYLLGERQIRPIIALALSTGLPSEPQLPGVGARSVLTWTLGTGAVLFGLALIGVGGLHEPRFDRHRLSLAILVLSVAGLVIGLTVTVALARSLAEPIESLRWAFARVAQGDLDQQVPVDDGSEVGLLQAGFNQMVAGLRERERIRDLFGRQVGEDVARHALEHGVTLGGETRDVAVLFVDLQGSTTFAESRDPSEVV
jgi:adenylate cyclase